MNKPVIVIGGGGHAKVLIDLLDSQSISIIGITENRDVNNLLGIPIIGDDEEVFKYSRNDIELVNGVGSTSNSLRRKDLYNFFRNNGYRFKNLIHSSTVIAKNVTLNEGVQLMAGTVIQTGSSIGENTIVNTKASIDHDCRIGAHVHVAPGVTLSGGVTIGECCHIGAGAVLIQGVNIGKNSIVGAGAVVINDVPAGVTVVGVPAKVKK